MAKANDKKDVLEIDKDARLQNAVKRFKDMETARTPFEFFRDLFDLLVESKGVEDEDGKYYVNCDVIGPILEQKSGERNELVNFDVEPDPYEPNIADTEIAKHILKKRILEEERHAELNRFYDDLDIYGTGILFTGIRHTVDARIVLKGDTDSAIGSGFFNTSIATVEYDENWFFMPKNVPIRHMYFDNNALFQPDFSNCVDGCMLEVGDPEELKNKYGLVDGVEKDTLENLSRTQEDSPAYGIQTDDGQCVLIHYFNAVTREWTIITQYNELLYAGWNLMAARLPRRTCQNHTRNRSLYGKGEPEILMDDKAVYNAVYQGIIDGVRLNSGKILLSGNSGGFSDAMDDIVRTYSGEISIKEVTNSVDNYKELDTRIDINPMMALMSIVDDKIRTGTGIDHKASFEVAEDKLGQTEIKEENKTKRLKPIVRNRDLCIGGALTDVLENFKTFAPKFLSSTKEVTIKGGKGKRAKKKIINTPYTLQLEGVKITSEKKQKKVDGKMVDTVERYVEEDLGNYGQLELSEDFLKGRMKVRIITGTTNMNTLKAIERNKFDMMGNNLERWANIYGADKVAEKLPFDDLWEKAAIVYGFEQDMSTRVKSQGKKKKQEAKAELDKALGVLDSITGNKDIAPTQDPTQATQQPPEAGGQPNEADLSDILPSNVENGGQQTQ